MCTTTDHTNIIIEITESILAEEYNLTECQREIIETIQRHAQEFGTAYNECLSTSLETFRSFLNHDAMTPLSVIIGYTELLLMERFGELEEPSRTTIEMITEHMYLAQSSVKSTYQEVLNSLGRETI